MNSHSRDESTIVDLAGMQAHQQIAGTQVGTSKADPQRPKRNSQRPGGAGPLKNSFTAHHEPKECPRHEVEVAPNRMVTRELPGKRVVYLYYASDVALFDQIKAWKRLNPGATVDEAIDNFEEFQGADAYVAILWETHSFDVVFKHTIAEYKRKVSDEPPVLGLGPTLSDLELDEQARAIRNQEKLQRQREAEQMERERALQEKKDIEAQPEAIKDPEVIAEEHLEHERSRFKKALLKEGLVIEEEPNIEGEEMFVKIYTPFWRLCVEAQRLHVKIELAQPAVEKQKRDLGSGLLDKYMWKYLTKADNVSIPLRAESLAFKASKLRHFAGAERNRKWSDIVRHGGGIRAEGQGAGSLEGSDGRDGFFGTAKRGHLTASILSYAKIHTKRGDRLAVKSIMRRKAYSDVFALHDGSYKSKVSNPNRRTLLFKSWVMNYRSQPLEEIRFYYGEKIALYFAWVGHYTTWLWSAAIVGLLFLFFGIGYYNVELKTAQQNQDKSGFTEVLVSLFDNPLTLPYALFMSIWAALFTEYWKRKSTTLAYTWNMLDYEATERARPEFRPTKVRVSPVTGRNELYYPYYLQVINLVNSIIVLLVCIGIVIVSVGSLIIFNAWAKNKQVDNSTAAKISGADPDLVFEYGMNVLTALLNLVVIVILGTVYSRIADVLTNKENHRKATEHEDALIVKRYVFDFVNFYATLFYIAFFKEWASKRVFDPSTQHLYIDKCTNDNCMGDLTIQLAIVFVGKQLINNIQELAIPQFQKYWNRKEELAQKARLSGKYKDKQNKKKPPQWAKDDQLPSYENKMFDEYRELVLQFGFCTLFVTAFPLAPIFALLNNLLEIRVDAYKLLTQHRRPMASPAQDIGSWGLILAGVTHLSVLTNALLLATQSNWLQAHMFTPLQIRYGLQSDLVVKVFFVVIFEHVVFALKLVIGYAVTDMPLAVKLAMDREAYYTRLALDDEEPAVDEVLDDKEIDSDESDDEEGGYFRPATDSEKAPNGVQEEALEELEEEEEDEEELEAMIKAGGCGCPAHGDATLGTAHGGFEGTWMNRFKNETQAAIRRRKKKRAQKHERHD